MNSVIRSKATGLYGNIVGITSLKVIVDFTKEGSPVEVSFNDFLKYCECDEEIRQKVVQLKAIIDEINANSNTLENI